MTAHRLFKDIFMNMRVYATSLLCAGIVIGIVLAMLVLPGEVNAQGLPSSNVSNHSALHSELLVASPIPTTYTLQAGEYPFCIARRFNVNPTELLSLNGLTSSSQVTPGQVLQIPQTGHPFPGTRALHPSPAVYTVKTGDTIYTIACYYGDVDPIAIAAANSLSAPYSLTSGQVLQIPGSGPTLTPSLTPTGPTPTGPTPTASNTSTPAPSTTYTLQAGEYPYCIARRFNVNPDELLNLNGLSRYRKVSPGTVLKIPQTGLTFPGTRALHPHPATYTVAAGDTIYTVACYYGDVEPMAIVTANSLVTPYTLTPGQTLQIPGAGPILTPSSTPTGPTPTPSLTLTGPTPTPSLTLTPAAIPTSYTIHEGEYPYCIARRFNVNPDELLSLNGLSRYQKVSTGMVLQIPQTGHTFPGIRALHPHPTTYTVKSGDTIYIVACYYGDVDPMAIATANSLVAPYSLTVGQTLQIPGAGPYPTITPTTGATSTATLTRTPTATVTSTATTTSTATATATATPLAFTSCASIIGLTQPAECEALVALYTGTNGATWTNRTGWLATNAPCSWYGVACTSGRVTQLVLGNNNLIGTLPSQLGSLTNLIVLNLASNQLSGTIPTELGNLVNLSSLYFQENALSGEIQTTITNLSATVNFNIGYNMLSPTNAGVITFLNGKQANWASTQTVPPTNVLVVTTTSNTVQLSWTPITYTTDSGSYEVLYATASGGPYTSHGTTIDKTASGYTVTGLTPSTTYYLVVRTTTPAHGTQQNALTSSYSLEISATTTP